MDIYETPRRMKYTMKNISLFTCSVMASIVVLSACAQTSVSVRPTTSTDKDSTIKPVAAAPRRYDPISRDEPYTVQAGDTLYGISFRAGLSYRELAVWNNIAEPYTVKIGQRLSLRPADVKLQPDTTAANVETKPAETAPPIIKPVMPAPSQPAVIALPTVPAVSKPVVPVTPIASTSEKPVPVTETKPVDTGGVINWRWPSDGTVIARYVQGDPTQQGINIGGKSGQPVKASSDGTVVYSGAGLVGYGELIIIKHNNEWLSAYAHNRRRLVAEGTKVKAGDVIAEMGRTGTIRDMLHFEIRRNGKPVDPLQYLPKQ
jgi:lipoprotein NlpD